MSKNPYISTDNYNYSGYGSVDLSYDDFEDAIKNNAMIIRMFIQSF